MSQAQAVLKALERNKGKEPIPLGILAIEVAAPLASVRRAVGQLRKSGTRVETFKAEETGEYGYNLSA